MRIASLVLVYAIFVLGCGAANNAVQTRPANRALGAIRNGTIAEVLSLVATHPSLIKWQDEYGRTLLHHAAGADAPGMLDLVHQLVDLGADVDAHDFEGATPLHHSVAGRDTHCVLLMHGADLNAVTDAGHSALHWAAFASRYELALELLGAGAEPDIYALCSLNMGLEAKASLDRTPSLVTRPDGVGRTSLHYAAKYGGPELVSLLIERGGNVNAKEDRHFQTPLHFAAAAPVIGNKGSWTRRRSLEKLQLLLAHGADVSAKDRRGKTPIALAAGRKWEGTVRVFLEHPGESSGDTDRKNTPPNRPTDDDPASDAPTPENGD